MTMRRWSQRFDRFGPTVTIYALPVPVRPQLRTLAVVLVLLEAAVVAATAVVWSVRTLAGDAGDVSVALFLVVFAALLAVVLVVAARSLWRDGRGGRALVITWQLLQGATCVTLLGAGAAPAPAWAGLVLAALVLLLLLLSPPPARPAS